MNGAKVNLFSHTRVALVKYDAGECDRASMLSAASSHHDILKWELAELEATNPVREAYYLDTKHINSHANCMLVTICFMRFMTEKNNG